MSSSYPNRHTGCGHQKSPLHRSSQRSMVLLTSCNVNVIWSEKKKFIWRIWTYPWYAEMSGWQTPHWPDGQNLLCSLCSPPLHPSGYLPCLLFRALLSLCLAPSSSPGLFWPRQLLRAANCSSSSPKELLPTEAATRGPASILTQLALAVVNPNSLFNFA